MFSCFRGDWPHAVGRASLLICLLFLAACNDSSETVMKELESLRAESQRLNALLMENQKKLAVVEDVLVWRQQPLPMQLQDINFEIHEEMFVPYLRGKAVIAIDSISVPQRFYLDTHYHIHFQNREVKLTGNSISMVEEGRGLLEFTLKLPEHNLPIEDAQIQFKPHAWYEGFPVQLMGAVHSE